jgi:hypothetical protein
VAIVDRIVTDALPHQVGADGEAFEIVLGQQIALFPHVSVFLKRLVDIEMVAPAGEL